MRSYKRQSLIVFIFANMRQYPHTLKNIIYYSDKWEPPTFFHLDTNPVLDHILVHSVNKTHALLVTVELVWLLLLNTVSFNLAPMPSKSFRFTRFRTSYINRTAVIQSHTAFLLDVQSSRWPRSFCSCLFPMIVHLSLDSICTQ